MHVGNYMSSSKIRTPLWATSEESTPERIQLTICLAVYGGTLGAAALLVNLLSRTKFPQIPEHMAPGPAATYSITAFVFCAALAGGITYWVARRDSLMSSLLKWLAAGFGFGVLSAPWTGASLPVSTVFLGLQKDVISVGELPLQLIGALFKMPSFGFNHGVFGLFTGLLAGALFGFGAWIISNTAYSSPRWLSAYGPYVIAIVLSIIFYGISVLAPAPTLARFG